MTALGPNAPGGGDGPVNDPATGDNGGVILDPGTGTVDPNGVDAIDNSCLTDTQQAEAIDLDIFIMLDSSGSMLDTLPAISAFVTPPTKWDAVRSSIETFVQAPETADIGVGLQYFPQHAPGVTSFFCGTNDDCGTQGGGPCSNSYCVVDEIIDDDPALPPLEFFRQSGEPLATLDPTIPPQYCQDNSACAGANESCRTLTGQCVVLPGTLATAPNGLFPGFDVDGTGNLVPALCATDADCAGVPSTRCQGVGLCTPDNVAVTGFCAGDQTTNLVTIPCAAGETCLAFNARLDAAVDSCVNGLSCEVPDYGAAAVPINQAADRSDAILTSLAARIPDGLTPTGPALSGAVSYATDWANQNPGRQVVVILATDGFPTQCTPLDIPDISTIAADGVAATPSIRTFVIGVFGTNDLGTDGQTNLDALAVAGGTDQAFIINTGGDVTQEFLDTLNLIRDTSVSCDFQLDNTTGALDFTRVNLQVTDSAGMQVQLANVTNEAGCANDDQGWYYVRDANDVPTLIRVCPGICESFMAGGVTAELQIGCETILR